MYICMYVCMYVYVYSQAGTSGSFEEVRAANPKL